MEFYTEEGKHLHEECSTLILPALSIGNVGQLAVDLLISSTRAERIGYLDDPNVLPCVGNDAYLPAPQGDLCLPLEAYDSAFSRMTLVQQRSPVVKGMMVEFAKNVADFAAASGKKHAILLSSLDFGRWQSMDMSSGSQIYYLSSASMDGTDDDCERLGWKRLQAYNPAHKRWKYLTALAEGNVVQEDSSAFEEELGEEDYYPSLPFAAMFSCFKATNRVNGLYRFHGRVSMDHLQICLFFRLISGGKVNRDSEFTVLMFCSSLLCKLLMKIPTSMKLAKTIKIRILKKGIAHLFSAEM